MIKKILTVGGYTLLSRLTGFMRDIMLAAILGAGPTADAFFVAFRLPNHFRAIFAEGAFNAAFIPAYARVRTQEGKRAADQFGDRIFTLLFASQVVLLALALLFTPQVIALLAPGFSREPHQFALAVSLTRITFPYLLLITLVTLWSGILNALHRFAAAAAAPILLNLTMMATLACCRILPWCRLRRGLGCADIGCPAGGAGRRRYVLCRRHDVLPDAAARQRRAALLQGAHSGDRGLGGYAARALCRHHHRQLSVGRRHLGAVLRRPHRSAPDRRDRHCGGHRAGAGNDASAGRRRRGGRPLGAKSRHRICAAAGDPLRRRLSGRSGTDHAGLVHARRLQRRRRACGGDDADGLYDWPYSLRADPQRGRAVLCPRRHRDPGQGGADRHRRSTSSSRSC